MRFLFLLFIFSALGSPSFKPNKFPETIAIEGGSFTMGSNEGEDYERPAHKVTVSDFLLGKQEVTVAEFKQYCVESGKAMPAPPPWGWNDNEAMVNVNWADCDAYCKWLSQKTGKVYRLPTEAEWEYAARGGNKGKGYKFAGSDNVGAVAWYDLNSGKRVQPVATKQANEVGVFDMSGNVWEWCNDYYSDTYYAKSPEKDPAGPPGGRLRVQRSGSWINYHGDNRVWIRISNIPTERDAFFGFRVAMNN